MAYRPRERPIEVEECPLCRSVLGKPRREFVKHVGRHMEQIALMALPREATDDSDAESACTAQEDLSHEWIGFKHLSPRRDEGRNAGISVSDDELDAISPYGSSGKAHHPKAQEIVIPKNQAYVNPVFCDKCNYKPEGFRGPHELRRHIENKHSDHRTVWVCVDRSPDQKLLSKCRPCNEGKQYGSFYSAAAHLRRIHFTQKKSRPRDRGRGGDGEGQYPPMEILKLWIEEVSVSNGPQTQRSYETQNSPYHLENVAKGAAASGIQLEIH